MSNVLISVASEFDSKGFKSAEKATSALDKQVNKLGKTLIGAFSIHKVMQYSKASVLAYADDRKAAALLANQLKNLGYAYSSVDVEKFIANMEATTGILDDELRPAFSKLIRTTGDLKKTQDLMSIAFDASRGSGVDFAQTVDIISKAYVGNYKGLRSLNLGITQAEMKTLKFSDVVKKLNQQFKGAGATSVDTYAGKIDLLKVSLANAQEIVGEGFVDAFTMIANDQDFNAVLDGITNMATYTADTLRGIGSLLDQVNSKTPDWLKTLATNKFVQTAVFAPLAAIKNVTDGLAKAGAKTKVSKDMPTGAALFLAEQNAKTAAKQALINAKNLAKADAARLASQKKITAEKKAQAALDKANIALGAANNVFDIERIGVAAAMQNQTLTENEKKRLEIKQAIFALEDAIDSKDTARITKQTDILNGLLGQFATMQAQASLLDKIKIAFDTLGVNKDLINLKNLQEALDLLTKMAVINIGGTNTGTVKNNSGIAYNPPKPEDKPDGVTTEDWNKIIGDYNNAFNEEVVVPPPPSTTSSNSNVISIFAKAEKERLNALSIQQAQYAAQAAGLAAKYGGYVTVNIAGDLQKLIDSITYETQNASANGTPIMLDRNATNLAW